VTSVCREPDLQPFLGFQINDPSFDSSIGFVIEIAGSTILVHLLVSIPSTITTLVKLPVLVDLLVFDSRISRFRFKLTQLEFGKFFQ